MSCLLIGLFRQWRIARLRKCVCRGLVPEPDLEPEEFLVKHQYRAAVFMARLRLENEICHLFQKSRSIRNDRIHVKSTPTIRRVSYLVKCGSFDAEFQRQFNTAYNAASKVIHGRPCPKRRAYAIVKQVREVIALLANYERPFERTAFVDPCAPRKPILGFATEGGAA